MEKKIGQVNEDLRLPFVSFMTTRDDGLWMQYRDKAMTQEG